ncbi:vitellogenin-1-like [Teleopsis dalmanni]|uniref:vitellogenin-1-like n=1 Tax=Teleopsis dalmanni TaxID=139649 RepID=UPI0018CDBF4F|nr:vitellogenin-1-like [Teleopsis dalmanni]
MRVSNIIAFFFLIVVGCVSVNSLQASFRNVISSAKDIGVGVVKDVANILPTPKGMFEASKQLIAGYPFEFVSGAINQICSAALSSETISPKITPNISVMQFQLCTACNKYNYSLLNAEDMWKSPEFDSKKKVVIFATGWTTTINDNKAIETMAKAYNCRGDVNFVALDAGRFVDTLYTWSAFNTDEIGLNLAKGLVKLSKIVSVEKIHLMGHSLGAHIVGAAGRYFQQLSGSLIPRITGLDPAKPCFNEGATLSGLLRGDADFIDIIHSNPGVLGKRDPMGDIDFYPGGLDPLPTGCVSVVCAHERAWRYFAESVYPGSEANFFGKRCTSLTRLREGKCPGYDVPMGFAVPRNAKGNYFLEVNGAEPFGKNGAKALMNLQKECGLCKTETKRFAKGLFG